MYLKHTIPHNIVPMKNDTWYGEMIKNTTFCFWAGFTIPGNAFELLLWFCPSDLTWLHAAVADAGPAAAPGTTAARAPTLEQTPPSRSDGGQLPASGPAGPSGSKSCHRQGRTAREKHKTFYSLYSFVKVNIMKTRDIYLFINFWRNHH